MRNYLVPAAIFGGLGIVLGAFGAHSLETITTDQKILHGFQTGVQYQLYHALALLGMAALAEKFTGRWLNRAANCFIAGIVLFSGSLYLLTYLKIQGSSAVKIAGPVTPLGGIFFIAGWTFLLMAAIKKK